MAGGTSAVYSRKIRIIDLTIVVSGGSGSENFTATGVIHKIAVKSPGGSSWGYTIFDNDGFGLEGHSGLSTDLAETVDDLCHGTNTMTVTGTDGTYYVRLRVESGSSFP